MELTGQVGPQVLADGADAPFRVGKVGEIMVSGVNPAYYENAYRGNVFFTGNQAAVTFAANGLTTASAVGMAVYNPASSGKNLIPIQAECVMTNYVTTSTDVQVVAVVSAYSATAPTTASALTIYKAQGAGTPSGSVALAASSLTFAANSVVYKVIYAAFVTTTIAAAVPTSSAAQPYEFKGALIIPPGTGIAFIANNASTGLVTMSWIELPV